MIVWSGLGFLVVVFALVAALVTNLISDATLGPTYFTSHHWPLGLSMLLAAVPTWYVGTYLRNRKARTMVDKETGQEVVVRGARASLFFISMHHWGVILAALGVVAVVLEFVK